MQNRRLRVISASVMKGLGSPRHMLTCSSWQDNGIYVYKVLQRPGRTSSKGKSHKVLSRARALRKIC